MLRFYYYNFRDLELRRRKQEKENKKVATEEHLNEIKRKMKETEDWKCKKDYYWDTFREKAVPFLVGLFMIGVSSGYYYYTKS